MGNHSKFIRPGAIRIGFHGSPDLFHKYGMLGSAYIHQERREIIIVISNHNSVEQEVYFFFPVSFPKMRTLTPFITSEKDNLVQYPEVSVFKNYTLPAQSIVTLVGNY